MSDVNINLADEVFVRYHIITLTNEAHMLRRAAARADAEVEELRAAIEGIEGDK